MPSTNIFKPKQQRSQDTQQKLINAVYRCLENKFFEHISIKEIADHAGVSVGTFYRRFKDKESLLPLLYQDFGNDLSAWVRKLEQREYTSLENVVDQFCLETYEFLQSKRSVFRTLHLNSRLHSEILDSDKMVDRKSIYQDLAKIVLRYANDIDDNDKDKKASVAVYMVITGLLDKVVYPQLTPAIACDIDAQEFAHELPKMILAYITSAKC